MSIEFIDFCRSHGIIISSLPDIGLWKRYRTEDKPRHMNGSVKFMGDHGFVQNHATMDHVAVWRRGRDTTPVFKHDNRKEIQDARRKEDAERANAIKSMREHWGSLPLLWGNHPYLTNKNLSMHGCKDIRIDGDLLVIPVYRDGSIISLQTISPDGQKKYRYGCPIKRGCYHISRKGSVITCLAEGFATGLAVYQSIPNASVIVCFDAGNMKVVADKLKLSGMCVICADNDHETEKRIGRNPGIDAATEAANAVGCGIAYPVDINGSDWADALIEWGESGPGRLRMEIMKGAKPVRRNSAVG